MNDFLTMFAAEEEASEFDFPLIDLSEEDEQHKKEEESDNDSNEIGILPLKNNVLLPGVVIPVTVGRESSLRLIREVNRTKHKRFAVLAQKSAETDEPMGDDLHEVGVVARILKLFKMPDGSVTIVVQGRSRFRVGEFTQQEPYLKAKIIKAEEDAPSEKQVLALMRNLRKTASKIVDISPNIPQEAKIALENIDSLSLLTYFIASNLTLDFEEKQKLLEMDNLRAKAELILRKLEEEFNVLELSAEIQSKVKVEMDKQNRDFMLRQQIAHIQEELGEKGGSTELEELKAKAKDKKWSKEAAQAFEKEIAKLSRLNPAQPDYAAIMNYLDWLIELPWNNYSIDKFDFKKTRKILDEEHAGLEKVKERILEHLAVLKLKTDKKSPILCLYGPPGVGKTSLGKSIAKSLGRDYVRMSLGGVRDEAEIRGHRRTYVASQPGRVLQSMKKAKTNNPVFILDEIDKVGSDHRGDPSSALLEVLDPQQNSSFQDHFLEVEYDLSRVMFIATANNLSTIHPALRDRMEIIEITGYSLEEKIEIAKKHLIPDALKEHGLTKKDLKLTDKAIQNVIEGYTRESGVRKLTQQIAALCRACAKKIVMNEDENADKSIRITDKNLEEFLGMTRFENETFQKIENYGVAIGLAWTPVGGDILFIESNLLRGKGILSMTGQLGDVMKESATLAFTFLKSHAEKLNIPYEVFENWNVHLHIPAGAIPKDGPSAGITMLSTLASLFTHRKVKSHLAMSGEITLRGKVLPVGGIKEKVLAAARSGIKEIILCKDNKKDVKEIKPEYIQNITFHYVDNMMEVLDLALEEKPMENPNRLIIKKEITSV